LLDIGTEKGHPLNEQIIKTTIITDSSQSCFTGQNIFYSILTNLFSMTNLRLHIMRKMIGQAKRLELILTFVSAKISLV